MNPEQTARIRDTVYVIGAGFSAGLECPLTKTLLVEVWQQLPDESRNQLQRIIKFHHPSFHPARTTSFPGIEHLLTQLAVNLEFFDFSRPAFNGITGDTPAAGAIIAYTSQLQTLRMPE
jgi:hypothetical protein